MFPKVGSPIKEVIWSGHKTQLKLITLYLFQSLGLVRIRNDMFRSVGHELKLSAHRIRRVKTVLEHVGLYVGLALYTAVGGMVGDILISCLCSFSSLQRCSRWLKTRQRWKLGVLDMEVFFFNIAKGTTDPRVEFISQVQTQILIKSKSRPSINLKISIKHQHID